MVITKHYKYYKAGIVKHIAFNIPGQRQMEQVVKATLQGELLTGKI